MKMPVFLFLLLILLTGCVQDSNDMGLSTDYDPEHEIGVNPIDHLGPASDLMVPDHSPGQLTRDNTQDTDSQRDYGWHKNRLNSVRTGRVKDSPHLRDDPENLARQAEEINQQYEDGQEDTALTIKDKIEMLDAVSRAHVVSHDGQIYIGIEGESINEDHMEDALSTIVDEEGDQDFVWHTDRRSVNRIRAAEKIANPNHERGLHEWFEDVEYELQQTGDDWNN
nr:YhcN/YlaJ family sporulation lipoprotein [Geomicrobium halophilum]